MEMAFHGVRQSCSRWCTVGWGTVERGLKDALVPRGQSPCWLASLRRLPWGLGVCCISANSGWRLTTLFFASCWPYHCHTLAHALSLPRPPPAIAAGLLVTCPGPADRRWSRAAACTFALAVCFHLVLQSTLTLSSTPGRAHDQLYRDMGLVSSQLHVLNLSYSVIFLNLSCSVSLVTHTR